MSEPSIHLTESAARRVQSFLDAEGGEGLRLGVRRTGCSGWAYEVALAREIRDEDRVFEQHGVRVVVDPDAWRLVAGTEIDFVREGLQQAFSFRNPNVSGECGCGESFTVGSAA